MVSSTWSVRSYTPSDVCLSATVFAVEPGGQRRGLHLARVRARGVEHRAAGPVDRPGVDPVEDADVLGVELGAAALVGQALPAAADADDLVAELGRAVDDALDDRVEAGNVAAAGEDADPSRCSHGGLRCGHAGRWSGRGRGGHPGGARSRRDDAMRAGRGHGSRGNRTAGTGRYDPRHELRAVHGRGPRGGPPGGRARGPGRSARSPS